MVRSRIAGEKFNSLQTTIATAVLPKFQMFQDAHLELKLTFVQNNRQNRCFVFWVYVHRYCSLIFLCYPLPFQFVWSLADVDHEGKIKKMHGNRTVPLMATILVGVNIFLVNILRHLPVATLDGVVFFMGVRTGVSWKSGSRCFFTNPSRSCDILQETRPTFKNSCVHLCATGKSTDCDIVESCTTCF